MFLVDLEKGASSTQGVRTRSRTNPYAEWIERSASTHEVETEKTPPLKSAVQLLDRQQAFAYTQEDIRLLMAPMRRTASEPWLDGKRLAASVLSNKTRRSITTSSSSSPRSPIRRSSIREELVTRSYPLSSETEPPGH